MAKEAGGFIADQRKIFSRDKIEHKGTHDMVSYVDKEAEKITVAGLRKLLPEAGFITEEGTVENSSDKKYTWIIDPLDGTTNFIHGLPPYCVSIALAEGDKIVVGVVYEITIKECFYAWKDSDAYLNGQIIKVSEINTLDESLIAVGLAHASQHKINNLLKEMDYFLRNTNGVRRLGSAAADLAYVAAGRFDAFYQCNLSPWDVAAGTFICERAGGCVTDYNGGTDFIFGRRLIASNGRVHNELSENIVLE